jgi:hypothetical protein
MFRKAIARTVTAEQSHDSHKTMVLICELKV